MKRPGIKLLAFATVLLFALVTLAFPVSAAVPDPYFDLEFKDSNVYDKMGNTNMVMIGGKVAETQVTYDGKSYNATAYIGAAEGEYVEVELSKFASAEEWGNFLLSGCTFELFIQVEQLPGATVGFLTSCNGGNVTLYLRGPEGQLNFQIGTDNNDSELGWGNYASAVPNDYKSGPHIDPAQIAHVVGTYDPADNKLRLYYNGVLCGQGDRGTGNYHAGDAFWEVLGIGQNPSYPSETMGKYTEYKVLDARVYGVPLTAEQVVEEYNNKVSALTGISLATQPEPASEPEPAAQPETAETPVTVQTAAETPVKQATAPQTFDSTSAVVTLAACAAVLAAITAKKAGKAK